MAYVVKSRTSYTFTYKSFTRWFSGACSRRSCSDGYPQPTFTAASSKAMMAGAHPPLRKVDVNRQVDQQGGLPVDDM
jgi:hypothetical protein